MQYNTVVGQVFDFIFLMTGNVYFRNRLRNTRESVGLKPTLSIPTNPPPHLEQTPYPPRFENRTKK